MLRVIRCAAGGIFDGPPASFAARTTMLFRTGFVSGLNDLPPTTCAARRSKSDRDGTCMVARKKGGGPYDAERLLKYPRDDILVVNTMKKLCKRHCR
jgi:hypothetical protein